ncbi:hypothetical protein Pmar_PMAR022801 [Perkinsus marinus ATCC 50983]|uniref:GLTSCR protein conserved domain-containing protein n=1 Tax=Perkinsus marinus (strain ATCC 50983 / TXsc) TaxID=423536 RepID=C5L1G1_PERM5|nr:hypothetical protein Pmar_PMAR022801 [Perkinsus marinus ATCC 50983]EER09432.1 hypothetical protein Pmar_PMAR022801 [Perkinsus marinus ATCC 50983]|eukprot:XP_002777616.1 hypothetical protein Pmar_PMAR022801 [Perkinsus marinus ATCC 50983]
MLKSEVPTTRGFGTSAAFSAIERLLPYHACYEPGADADDSAAHLDTVIANIGARVLAINKQTKLCREATKRDAAKRKLNVVKSIELEELSHKSGRLRQESKSISGEGRAHDGDGFVDPLRLMDTLRME